MPQDALGAPYRIPRTYFKNIHKEGPLPLPECPLIVFINARSGGRDGPALALALNRAVSRAQVGACFTAQISRQGCSFKQVHGLDFA